MDKQQQLLQQQLNQIFSPRVLPDDITTQVGDISPYRKVVQYDFPGNYHVYDIPDTDEMPLVDENICLVSVSHFVSGKYPSDVAAEYALTIIGMLQEPASLASLSEVTDKAEIVTTTIPKYRTYLCFDENEVDMSLLIELLENPHFKERIQYVYTDDEETSNKVHALLPSDILHITYRQQVVWQGKISQRWVERLQHGEMNRRYQLMMSKIDSIINKISVRGTGRRSPLYRSTPSFALRHSELALLVKELGCGLLNHDFIRDIPDYPDITSNIDDFIAHHVSFSRVEPIFDEIRLSEPDYQVLQDTIEIWKTIVFVHREELPKSADLLDFDMEGLAESYAIESYVDALISGVPLEDLIA